MDPWRVSPHRGVQAFAVFVVVVVVVVVVFVVVVVAVVVVGRGTAKRRAVDLKGRRGTVRHRAVVC